MDYSDDQHGAIAMRYNFSIISVFFLWFFFNTGNVNSQAVDPNLKVHFIFDNLSADNSQVIDNFGDTATLKNNSNVKGIGNFTVLDLGNSNGYLDLGSKTGNIIASLTDFTISTYLYIDASTPLDINGNFIWAFANSDDVGANPNGQMFLSAKTTRYAISETDWTGESALENGKALTKGSWQHIAYTQSGNSGTIFLNGVAVETGAITLTPGDLGPTPFNYIGKSPYAGDAYLSNSLYYDFRIYNKALSGTEISMLDDSLTSLRNAFAIQSLQESSDSLVLIGLNHVVSNLNLPTLASNGTSISWESSDTTVISNVGIVVRPSAGSDTATITLTATLSNGGFDQIKEFIAAVLPLFDDKTCVKTDSANLTLEGQINNLLSDINLPGSGYEGSTITWVSDNTEYLSNDGKLQKLAPNGSEKLKVTLTATLQKGTESVQKPFDVYIAEDEGYSAYLFVYFTGNAKSEEQIRFALSNDGLNYQALNGNNPVISSPDISLTGGVRDPHIYRGPDGNFYMVVTDMVSANGWDSNRGIVLLKSGNLIDWTSTAINIPTTFPDEFSDITRAWAPQTIYDDSAKKMMVYFSMKKPNGIDIIYYSYANVNFTALETTPEQLFYSPTDNSCIDGDILYKDGVYNLFFKTEGNGDGIKKATSTKLTEGYELYDTYLDQSDTPVEGAGTFKLINSDTYILMYDVYTTEKYEFTKSTDLVNFKIENEGTSMNFTPRHGTVIPITQAEAETLSKKWAKESDLVVISSNSKFVKKRNIVVNTAKNTVFLPVRNGTNLSAFSPMLTSMPGAKITPGEPQDFTENEIVYTISIDGIGSKTYKVTANINNNPLLEGYYADPEILYSNKTGKYYLYPTSDGFTGWSGDYFKSFSSTNLTDWADEGIILNLPTDVSWANTNAWAPTIIEKMVEGKYNYFYYFTAAQKIGVAVADDPAGPFTDSGQPLISNPPTGVWGQQIDPDVFYDQASDKTYLFWGNGYLARAELNKDMVSLNNSTIKVITPNSTFREGVEVFKRNDTYYFMWSENDTRSPDYRVRYGYSNSITGTISVPKNNIVISRNDSLAIYGTGHNCVVYVPDSNKWYIIYHRFTRPKGIKMGDAAGYNREVCIDELTFNNDGTINQVKPSLSGFESMKVINSLDKTKTSSNFLVYPNPAKSILNISLSKNTGNYSIAIYDLMGRKQLQKTLNDNKTQLDISKLKAGVYIIELTRANIKIDRCSFVVN